LGIAKRFITKLWNASRFALTHLQDLNIQANTGLMPVDRWIMERCKQTAMDAKSLLE
jgi:valyl-tRNA synthetase